MYIASLVNRGWQNSMCCTRNNTVAVNGGWKPGNVGWITMLFQWKKASKADHQLNMAGLKHPDSNPHQHRLYTKSPQGWCKCGWRVKFCYPLVGIAILVKLIMVPLGGSDLWRYRFTLWLFMFTSSFERSCLQKQWPCFAGNSIQPAGQCLGRRRQCHGQLQLLADKPWRRICPNVRYLEFRR